MAEIDGWKLQEQIEKATKQGWKLCAGCIGNFDESCTNCGIEKRKRMGLPPKQIGQNELEDGIWKILQSYSLGEINGTQAEDKLMSLIKSACWPKGNQDKPPCTSWHSDIDRLVQKDLLKTGFRPCKERETE